MSLVFVPERLRARAQVTEDNVQRLLEENDQLIRCIVEYQNRGEPPNVPSTSKFCTGILSTWQP